MAERNDASADIPQKAEVTSTAIDVAHVVVVLGVLILYGISLYNGHSAPQELATALSVLVGSIVGRSMPK